MKGVSDISVRNSNRAWCNSQEWFKEARVRELLRRESEQELTKNGESNYNCRSLRNKKQTVGKFLWY